MIEEDKRPRNPVPPKPAAMDYSSVNDMIKKDLEQTGANADEMSRVVEESTLGGGLMDINDWIDQTLAAKDYIQVEVTQGLPERKMNALEHSRLLKIQAINSHRPAGF